MWERCCCPWNPTNGSPIGPENARPETERSSKSPPSITLKSPFFSAKANRPSTASKANGLASGRSGTVSLARKFGRLTGGSPMKLLPFSTFSLVAVLMVAAPSSAQMQTPPKPQTASPTAPAQTTTVPLQSKPAASVPFPQDAKYAIVDVQAVASNSIVGNEASKKLNDLRAKKAADLQDKNKQLQGLQTKRDTSAPVLNDTARAQLDKEIDKLQRDIQYASSSAQADLTD